MKWLLLALLALFPAVAHSQPVGALSPPPAIPAPRSILFVGNSFTQGASSAVMRYRPEIVTDLNGNGIGGVPALFKTFADQAGLNWTVSLETQGGKTLAFHHDERLGRISGRYDVVVLQEYSTLDPTRPGDPARFHLYAERLARHSTRFNPKVEVLLMATWSRADLVYQPGSMWSGKPVETMARDLRRAADAVDRALVEIDGVIPVGEAWTRAMARKVADPNPYDGLAAGQLNLWANDHYHASSHGYYLEALVVFGKVTGIDPQTLGAGERAAADLGISREQARQLQSVAFEQLASERVRPGSRAPAGQTR